MAIRATFSLRDAHGMRDEGAEGLPAESLCRDRLLLVIDPITIVVLRTHQHSTCRAHRRDAMSRDRPIDGQAVDIVAQNLKIIGSPIASLDSLVVKHGHLLICSHRKMAA